MVKEVDAPCFLKPLFTLAVGHKSSCRGCRLTGTPWDQGCRVDEHWNAEPGDSQGVLCRAERTGSRHVELVSAQLWDPGAEHPSAPHMCQEHSHQLAAGCSGREKQGRGQRNSWQDNLPPRCPWHTRPCPVPPHPGTSLSFP